VMPLVVLTISYPYVKNTRREGDKARRKLKVSYSLMYA
jgi:hypothetical protein